MIWKVRISGWRSWQRLVVESPHPQYRVPPSWWTQKQLTLHSERVSVVAWITHVFSYRRLDYMHRMNYSPRRLFYHEPHASFIIVQMSLVVFWLKQRDGSVHNLLLSRPNIDQSINFYHSVIWVLHDNFSFQLLQLFMS